MTDEIFREEFQKISTELKKSLKWEIGYICPNCEHKSLEDAFKAIEIKAGLSDWDCPYCIMEQKGLHQDAPECDAVEPNFRELLETFQLHFLDGYVHALLVSQDRGIYLFSEDDPGTKPLPSFLYDLSSSFVKIYTAFEVYLSYRVRGKLEGRKFADDAIREILVNNEPYVKDYFEMWNKFGIWDDIGKMISAIKLKELKKIEGALRPCQDIRNGIVHRGKKASREDFLMVLRRVGRFIAGSQT
jgi:hypothetical protein